MMRHLISVCVMALLLGCVERVEHGAISDGQIGLSKGDVRDTPDPDPVVDDTTEPGERGRLQPVFEGAPPVISHSISDYLPITRDENLCLECHMIDGEKEVGLPTPIPASHYTDLRNAPSEVGTAVAGARYNCTLCHVTQTGAPLLVESRF